MATPSKLWVPDRRDMIWINFNPQVGSEMKDEHPMLVLSPKAFNERTNIVIGLPMTHASNNEKKTPLLSNSLQQKERFAMYLLISQSPLLGEIVEPGHILGNKFHLQSLKLHAKS